MAVIEAVLNKEKAIRLLDEGAESERLDYKRRCDLRERRDVVEIAKDFGAMQAEGGYIVAGVDNAGIPTGELDDAHARLFDEATLRDKLKKYVPEPFDLRSIICDFDGKWVAVVGTMPNAAGLVAFRADGTYYDEKREITVFRKGDVYVRHGSKSERCEQDDITRALDRIVAGRKEAWLAENVRAVKALAEAGALGRTLAGAPAAAFSWRLDADAFASATLELVRADDLAPIITGLDQMKHDADGYLAAESTMGPDELQIMLDRLACVAALGLRLGNSVVFSETLRTFTTIYAFGFSPEAIGRGFDDRRTPRLWLEVATRVIALGGLAVRCERWPELRALALQQPGAQFVRYGDKTPWLRHALTEAARANFFQEPGKPGRNTGALITLAMNVADRVSCVRPDCPASSDRVLDSLLQFDLLAVLVVMVALDSTDTSNWYPSFAFWGGWRSEPALVKLLSDDSIRHQVFGSEVDNEALLNAVWSAGGTARDLSHNFDGWESQIVTDYFAPVRERLFGGSAPTSS
jgi:hypothetical protein